jgi:hypothetical protein
MLMQFWAFAAMSWSWVTTTTALDTFSGSE